MSRNMCDEAEVLAKPLVFLDVFRQNAKSSTSLLLFIVSVLLEGLKLLGHRIVASASCPFFAAAWICCQGFVRVHLESDVCRIVICALQTYVWLLIVLRREYVIL